LPLNARQAAAVALIGRGLRVLTVRPSGKEANQVGWPATATSDPKVAIEWWGENPSNNIGCFADDVIFLDVDVKDGKQGLKSLAMLQAMYNLTPTYTQRSPTGGLHFAYRYPPGFAARYKTCANEIPGFPGIDIRASRTGYVAGAGSSRPDGDYTVERDLPIADGDMALLDILPLASAKSDKGLGNEALVELDTPAAIERAMYYLIEDAPEALEGEGGNAQTFKVVARVKDFGISRDLNLELTDKHWNEFSAKPPWSLDELSTIVNNVYRHGRNAVGISAPEAEFEAVELDNTKQPPAARRALFTTDWGDDVDFTEDTPLIQDVMSLGSMVVTYGDSNVGKTFVALDQCYHVASGLDWNGHKVTQGLVFYVAAEGGKGFQKRIAAYKTRFGVKRLPFTVVPCPIDLQSDQADTAKLVKLIQEAEARHGVKCVLVVIDTLARAIAGGDENTTVDMSKFVAQSDRLRAATGATVNIIHHTGKDKSKGARGSSALRAATDTEIEIDTGVVRVTKQRDMDAGAPMPFELLPVEIGHRSDGSAITSCVVNWIASAAGEFNAQLTPPQQLALDALDQLLSEAAKSGAPKRTVTPGEWCKAVETAKGGGKGGKQLLARVGPVLIQAGYVVKTANNQYVRIGNE
jgi:hypothetical protein